MNTVAQFFLRAKHWQIFSAVLALALSWQAWFRAVARRLVPRAPGPGRFARTPAAFRLIQGMKKVADLLFSVASSKVTPLLPKKQRSGNGTHYSTFPVRRMLCEETARIFLVAVP